MRKQFAASADPIEGSSLQTGSTISRPNMPYCLAITTSFLLSISPTFYDQLLRQSPFAKKLQSQNMKTAQNTFVQNKQLVKCW